MNLSVRKPLVIDYKLPYPTGTATGVMINSFFTNGDLAKQQVRTFSCVKSLQPQVCCPVPFSRFSGLWVSKGLLLLPFFWVMELLSTYSHFPPRCLIPKLQYSLASSPTCVWLSSVQALQLLKLGIFGFLFDFWTWFFDGNCATYIQALPAFTNTINSMPNLGFKCASSPPSLVSLAHMMRCSSLIEVHVTFESASSYSTSPGQRADTTQRSSHYIAKQPQDLRFVSLYRAFDAGWYFDFTIAYIGAGFITPLAVRCRSC